MPPDDFQRGRDGGPTRSTRRRAQLTLGLQRVVGVRVVLTDDGPVSQAIGVLHRRPVVQRISHSTAQALVAAGAPLAVRRPASTGRSSAWDAAADAFPEGH